MWPKKEEETALVDRIGGQEDDRLKLRPAR